MGRARAEAPKQETKIEEIETEAVDTVNGDEGEAIANTGDEAVDAFLNGETDELPEGTEEISIEKAEEMEKEKVEYIIEVKNKAYTGTAANVKFKDGIGITKNELLADYFKARGAKITKK